MLVPGGAKYSFKNDNRGMGYCERGPDPATGGLRVRILLVAIFLAREVKLSRSSVR